MHKKLAARARSDPGIHDRSGRCAQPDQGWLSNEAEVLSTLPAPQTLTIAARERKRPGRKKLAADLPRVELIQYC